jgi:hypothetical protein
MVALGDNPGQHSPDIFLEAASLLPTLAIAGIVVGHDRDAVELVEPARQVINVVEVGAVAVRVYDERRPGRVREGEVQDGHAAAVPLQELQVSPRELVLSRACGGSTRSSATGARSRRRGSPTGEVHSYKVMPLSNETAITNSRAAITQGCTPSGSAESARSESFGL